MAKKVARKATKASRSTRAPRSLSISAGGVETSRDFATLMSSLMSDIIGKRIDASAANAVCRAGGTLLRVVELQHKYGAPVVGRGQVKVLQLAPKQATEAGR